MKFRISLCIVICVGFWSGIQAATRPKAKDKKPVYGSVDLVRQFNGVETLTLEPYTTLQRKLEDIANKAGLYHGSEEEDAEILKNLFADPTVRVAIKNCSKLHTAISCTYSKYRALDGTCNNIEHPLWGSANYHTERYLPAAYEGINGYRKAVDGKDLPGPRNISLQLKSNNRLSHLVSAFFTFYGQAIAHDVTLSPTTSIGGLEPPCYPGLPGSETLINTSMCGNIDLGNNDPFFGQFNFTCMTAGRTAPYSTCDFGKRIQVNKKTSYVDLSIIYGTNEEDAHNVRTKDGSGKLRTVGGENGEYILPEATNENTLFCPINKTDTCFLAGDERVNQHINLMSLQTMFVRFHNIYCDILRGLNPHWTDEVIYQEARRVIIAIQQYIIYAEYLPLLVGKENMEKYSLVVDLEKGSSYDATMSANILSEFSTASFRLHSMVPKRIAKDHPSQRFHETYSFFDPIHEGRLSSFVSGACEVASEKNDRYVKTDIRELMYKPPGAVYAADLLSANIHRGRDHGLPPYVSILEKCSRGRFEIRKFEDLIHVMKPIDIKWLQNIYSNVTDIDLWIGMLLEKHVKGAVVGPTAACISSIQFHKLKFGDAFYFTHVNGRYPFKAGQLEFISSYSLTRWICETSKQLSVRKYPLKLPGIQNPLVPCANLPVLDTSVWKEHSTETA